MAEANFQISEKLTDTAIFVVRGSDYVEFSNNIEAVASDNEFRDDMNKFIRAVTGSDMVSPQQAYTNVVQAFPQAAPVSQGPAAHPAGSAQQGQSFTCQHGPRTFKEGRTKNGGTWSAYFCPVKGGCKPMSPDGTLWN